MPWTFRDRFRRALRRKPQQATGPDTKPEPGLIARERPPGIPDPRTKSTGKGKKTADKWNQ